MRHHRDENLQDIYRIALNVVGCRRKKSQLAAGFLYLRFDVCSDVGEGLFDLIDQDQA